MWHIYALYVNKLIIDSDKGLVAIIWANAGVMIIENWKQMSTQFESKYTSFHLRNAFENFVCKPLSRSQCVDLLISELLVRRANWLNKPLILCVVAKTAISLFDNHILINSLVAMMLYRELILDGGLMLYGGLQNRETCTSGHWSFLTPPPPSIDKLLDVHLSVRRNYFPFSQPQNKCDFFVSMIRV